MVRRVYGTGITQKRAGGHTWRGDIPGEEIHTEREHTQRGDIHGEGTHMERGLIGRGDTLRGDIHGEGTHMERDTQKEGTPTERGYTRREGILRSGDTLTSGPRPNGSNELSRVNPNNGPGPTFFGPRPHVYDKTSGPNSASYGPIIGPGPTSFGPGPHVYDTTSGPDSTSYDTIIGPGPISFGPESCPLPISLTMFIRFNTF